MLGNIKFVMGIAALGVVAYMIFGASNAQTADLGKVLDRTEFTMRRFQETMAENGVETATDDDVVVFSQALASVLNQEPRFYDKPFGVEVESDGKFLGFADENADGKKDASEADVFTVEIDSENNRLIATDMAGNSSGLRFSGAGFLAGMLIGNLLNRQRSAGIKPGSFNDRKVTPRSSYKAPSSARSGGLRAGK